MSVPRNLLPRSFLPLLVLLLGAAAWLWFGERGRPAGGEAGVWGGGRDFNPVRFPAGELASLTVGLSAGTVALARDGASAWRFTAGCDDDIDAEAAEETAAAACAVTASPLLPDDAGADTVSLGLAGPEAVSLRLVARDGRLAALTVGVRNPVRGVCYARIAGRRGIWGVPYQLRVRLLSLPDAVRLRQLWPRLATASVETVARRPAGASSPDLFARDADGAWWLRAPADGERRAGPVFVAYARLYADRVVRRDGVLWWRASDRALTDLIFKLGMVDVRGFGPRGAGEDTLRALGLADLPLSVRIAPRGAVAHAAVLGAASAADELFALRDGRRDVLRIAGSARSAAERPLAELLATDALPLALAGADSFTLAREGRPAVRAWRRDKGWATSLPSPPGTTPTAADRVGDLVLTLDRLPIGRPLPPAAKGLEPLAPANRFVLVVWQGARVAPAFEARIGTLPGPAGPAPMVAIWCPATGRLVTVAPELLVTLRAFFLAGGDAAS